MRHYTAFLMKRAVKLFVIAAFTTLLGLGVYGALGVKQGCKYRRLFRLDWVCALFFLTNVMGLLLIAFQLIPE